MKVKNNTNPIPQRDDLCRAKLLYNFFGSALSTQGRSFILGDHYYMELSVQDLIEITDLPNEEQLSLQILAMFYQEHFCHHKFHYEVRHKQRDIILHFKTTDLPHLLGIHKIKSGSAYRGKKGFPELLQGNLTMESLKQADIGSYERNLYRILHFPFLYQLLRSPDMIAFNSQLAGSSIDAQFMFYNKYSNRYVHLGIKQEDSTGLYVPVTFIERKNPYSNMTKVLIDSISITNN